MTPSRMWLRVSLCVSLVWLLVGQGGSGAPGTCQYAQDLYAALSSAYTSEQLNGVTISSDPAEKIFAEPSRGVDDGVCKLGSTCCSRDAEQLLRQSVSDGYRDDVIDLLSDRIFTCYNSSLKSAMAIYFTSSRDSLVTTMMRAFSVYFDRFVNIFDDFYEYLRDAMFTGSTCQLGSKFMQVNFEVFLASYLTSDYSTESDSRNLVQSRAYRRCFYDYFVELYALELSYSFGHFSRIINQTMRYMRALYVSDHIMETVLSQDLTTSCRNAMLKMTHCAQCASYSSPDTCGRLCLNTMRGCLVELSDLAEPFRQFAEAVVRMKNMVEPIIDQLTLLQADFFQVISFAEIQAPTIVNEVQRRCDANGRIERSAPVKRAVNLLPRTTVVPPSLQFNESAYCLVELQSIFSQLPERVCEGREEVSGDNQDCWNGQAVGSYEREVVAFTREAQSNNPEVLLCQLNAPRYRKEKALLQYITRELNILTDTYVCSDDDEDCRVDLTDTCDYYQLPQVEEESFEPTSVSSGDIEQQVACGESVPTTPSITTTSPTTDATTDTTTDTTTDATTQESTGSSNPFGDSGSRATAASWIAVTTMVSLALAVLMLDSVL